MLSYEIDVKVSNWALPWSWRLRTTVDVVNLECVEFSAKWGHVYVHANAWTKQWVRDAMRRVGLIRVRTTEATP